MKSEECLNIKNFKKYLNKPHIPQVEKTGKLMLWASLPVFASKLELLANPIIKVLLSEKWLAVVPLLQWLCLARVVTPISSLNMNILNAMGRSDLFLKVDLSKMPLVIAALIITLPMGVQAMVIGHAVTSLIAFFINAYLPGKYFGYGGFAQLKDMLPMICITALMAIIAQTPISHIGTDWLKLLAGCSIGGISYYLLAISFKIPEAKELTTLIKKFSSKFK